MKFLSSLDKKDRILLLVCLGLGILLAVAAGLLSPRQNDDTDSMPSSYTTGKHGARAAYELLLKTGYPVQRWERPLEELANEADSDTVVILAEPNMPSDNSVQAIRRILERGGRVLTTGMIGGMLVPNGMSMPSPSAAYSFTDCKLTPQGIDLLAGSGEVWMAAKTSWKVGNPGFRTQYNCFGSPAVVEYDWGKGHIVWWAGSTPLENGSILRAHDLDLLLNSLGPREGHHFYWDESLHGEVRSNWSYAAGPSRTLLWVGMLALAILVVFSFSRRSGPLRELLAPARATPMEFLYALGSLYDKAGAASTAVSIAWERFRRQTLRLCGQRVQAMNAEELAQIIRRRFPDADTDLEKDLAACQEATWEEAMSPREALRLIQLLDKHRDALLAATKADRHKERNFQSKERAS